MDESKPSKTAIFSVIIAAVALVLSQLPPVKSWFPERAVSLYAARQGGLTDPFGSPIFITTLTLENGGNRPFLVDKVIAELTYPNGRRQALGNVTALDIHAPIPLPQPAESIRVPVGERLTRQFMFAADLTPEEEKVSSSAQIKLLAAGFSPQEQQKAVQAVLRDRKSRTNLGIGTYSVQLQLLDARGTVVAAKKGTFTLFDFHIAAGEPLSERTLFQQMQGQMAGPGLAVPIYISYQK